MCHQIFCTKYMTLLTYALAEINLKWFTRERNSGQSIMNKMETQMWLISFNVVCCNRAVPWVAFERMQECEVILFEFSYYLHRVVSGFPFIFQTHAAIYIFGVETHALTHEESSRRMTVSILTFAFTFVSTDAFGCRAYCVPQITSEN